MTETQVCEQITQGRFAAVSRRAGVEQATSRSRVQHRTVASLYRTAHNYQAPSCRALRHGDVRLFVCSSVYRQGVLIAAGAYRVGFH